MIEGGLYLWPALEVVSVNLLPVSIAEAFGSHRVPSQRSPGFPHGKRKIGGVFPGMARSQLVSGHCVGHPPKVLSLYSDPVDQVFPWRGHHIIHLY